MAMFGITFKNFLFTKVPVYETEYPGSQKMNEGNEGKSYPGKILVPQIYEALISSYVYTLEN